jgi:nicotinamide-nucleotide amidase
MTNLAKRVAFVATGEEIIIGDIQDTNATYFSQQFIERGIQPGKRVIVGDDPKEIESAIRYLLPDHDALITIGGLGPTSDDLTRYALASALGIELKFHDNAWQWVEDIYLSKGLVTDKQKIPETNRQQALLPQGSTAIQNRNGTAAACYLLHENKDIFMLPGPPNECRPIFHDAVLPTLLKRNFAHKIYRKSWLLLGVSESTIAAKLDPLMTDKSCQLGYRVHYPYLEIKLWSDNASALDKLSAVFEPLLQTNVVSSNKQPASQQCIDLLAKSATQIFIDDQATGGALQHTLTIPSTYRHLHFNQENSITSANLKVTITGLDAYWQAATEENVPMPLMITIGQHGKSTRIEKKVLNRGPLTIENTVELICWELLKYLQH